MKDEIKEMNIPKNVLIALGDLTSGSLNYYKAAETVKVRHNTILDYMTNLQEENERLKEENNKFNQHIQSQGKLISALRDMKNIDYKSRIDKAIEYIKEEQQKIDEIGDNYCYLDEYEINDLLNILNGGDDNE